MKDNSRELGGKIKEIPKNNDVFSKFIALICYVSISYVYAIFVRSVT